MVRVRVRVRVMYRVRVSFRVWIWVRISVRVGGKVKQGLWSGTWLAKIIYNLRAPVLSNFLAVY